MQNKQDFCLMQLAKKHTQYLRDSTPIRKFKKQ